MSVKGGLVPQKLFERLVVCTVFAGIAFFYCQLNSSNWIITPDSTVYVEGARSLAQFKGYVDAQGHPISFYPPGTSLIYAFAAMVPRMDYYAFNLLTKFILLGFLLLSSQIVRRHYGQWPALGAILFLTFSIIPMNASIYLLSDLPFSLCFLATLYLFPASKLRDMKPMSATILGFFLAASFYIRTPGIFVFFGYIFYILIWNSKNKLRTAGVVLGIFGAFALLLLFRNSKIESEISYIQLMFLKKTWILDSGTLSVQDWVSRILENINVFYDYFNTAFSNQYGKSIRAISIICLALGGILISIRDRELVLYVWLTLFYIAELLITQTRDLLDIRYMIPLLPLLIIFIFQTITGMLNLTKVGWSRRLAGPFFILLILTGTFLREGSHLGVWLRESTRKLDNANILYLGHEKFQELVEKYGTKISTQDIILTMHANIVRNFIQEGVKVRNFALTEDPDKAYSDVLLQKASYLFIDKKKLTTWPGVNPMLKKYKANFSLVEENSGAAIYKIDQTLLSRQN